MTQTAEYDLTFLFRHQYTLVEQLQEHICSRQELVKNKLENSSLPRQNQITKLTSFL